MRNEGDVKKAVRKILDSYKDEEMWYFMPPANGYGRSGIPDFVGCYKGNLFAIETKYGANDCTANQLREIRNIIQAKGIVWIVRDTSLSCWEQEFRGWAAIC